MIRDVIECEGERHVEWLLHYEGGIRSEGLASIIENGGVRLVVTPFLPDRRLGWRWSDVTRTSLYECSDTRQEVTRSIRYRGFSAFRAADRVEFVFGMRLNGAASGDWDFREAPGGWELRAPASGLVVRPAGEGLAVE